jgi:hypothetical protein
MTFKVYVCGGICKNPGPKGQLNGTTEIFLYNPTRTTSQAAIATFFENRDPVNFPTTVETGPGASTLLVLPEHAPNIFENQGFWGLMFESNTQLIPVLIEVVNEITNTQVDVMWKGGVTHFLGTELRKSWLYPNCYWSDGEDPSVENRSHGTPSPFSEYENIYFLNPGERDADVEMVLQYRRLDPEIIQITVPAQRHFTWSNYGRVYNHEPYAVRITASEPITTSAVRYQYGLRGLEEYGVNIRAGMPAEIDPFEPRG